MAQKDHVRAKLYDVSVSSVCKVCVVCWVGSTLTILLAVLQRLSRSYKLLASSLKT